MRNRTHVVSMILVVAGFSACGKQAAIAKFFLQF